MSTPVEVQRTVNKTRVTCYVKYPALYPLMLVQPVMLSVESHLTVLKSRVTNYGP